MALFSKRNIKNSDSLNLFDPFENILTVNHFSKLFQTCTILKNAPKIKINNNGTVQQEESK